MSGPGAAAEAARRVHLGPLTDPDLAELRPLVDREPVVNAVVAARLDLARSLTPRRLGATCFGLHRGDALRAACFSGGNLIPLGGAPEDLRLLAGMVAGRPRTATTLVGRADWVTAMWAALEPVWGPARAVRDNQPMLALDDRPAGERADDVEPVGADRLERYLPAAAAMFHEELGVSVWSLRQGEAFRRRISELIAAGRAFASTDFRGQIVFKAEIAVVTEATAQIQGVWVRPDLRGRGLGTAGLARVVDAALGLAPSVSLYVNDFNQAALRVYEKLGMTQVATLASVLI